MAFTQYLAHVLLAGASRNFSEVQARVSPHVITIIIPTYRV